MKRAIVFFLAMAAAAPAFAAEKVPIFILSNAEDTVGASYVYKLRETLQASSLYTLVTKEPDAVFVISVVTMDPNDADLGSGAERSTVAAITLQVENTKGLNYLVHSWVLVANREKVDMLAAQLMAVIDKEVQDLIAQLSRKSERA